MSSITFTRDAALDLNADAPPRTRSAPTDARREQVRDVLEKLFVYLRDNAPSHPGLATAIREMHSAVAGYQSGSSENPFGPVRKVLQAIEQQRKLDPSLPQP